MGEPHTVRDTPRVAKVLGRAAAAVALGLAGEPVDQLHREADDRTAGASQQPRRDRAVHTPAHGNGRHLS